MFIMYMLRRMVNFKHGAFFFFILTVMQPRKLRRTGEQSYKRPEGMHRELYALLYSDSRSVEICFDGVVV